jgi:two-component system chemotaxis sensor kinase CheA
LLPLVSLHEELKVEWQAPAEDGMYIVVLRADDRQFGLVVERVHDTEEIVVKPLQKQLKGIGLYAGATIMGDGTVALILDVMGLAQQAHVVAGARQRSAREEAAPQVSENGRHNLLLFQSLDGGRMAIPLSLVARLEEFPRAKIEQVGPREVVQYRGEILPLVHIGGEAGRIGSRKRRDEARRESSSENGVHTDNIPVVVYAHQNARIGLVIGQILDIVDESVTVESKAVRAGVKHTAIVADRVTEILDIHEVIRAADPELLAAIGPSSAGQSSIGGA